MTKIAKKLQVQLREAVKHFWMVRDQQARKQGGADSSARDRGARSGYGWEAH